MFGQGYIINAAWVALRGILIHCILKLFRQCVNDCWCEFFGETMFYSASESEYDIQTAFLSYELSSYFADGHLEQNAAWQVSHLCGLSAECVFKCSIRVLLFRNFDPHLSHLQGRCLISVSACQFSIHLFTKMKMGTNYSCQALFKHEFFFMDSQVIFSIKRR